MGKSNLKWEELESKITNASNEKNIASDGDAWVHASDGLQR